MSSHSSNLAYLHTPRLIRRVLPPQILVLFLCETCCDLFVSDVMVLLMGLTERVADGKSVDEVSVVEVCVCEMIGVRYHSDG